MTADVKQMIIGGLSCAASSGDTFQVLAPADGRVLAEVALAGHTEFVKLRAHGVGKAGVQFPQPDIIKVDPRAAGRSLAREAKPGAAAQIAAGGNHRHEIRLSECPWEYPATAINTQFLGHRHTAKD